MVLNGPTPPSGTHFFTLYKHQIFIASKKLSEEPDLVKYNTEIYFKGWFLFLYWLLPKIAPTVRPVKFAAVYARSSVLRVLLLAFWEIKVLLQDLFRHVFNTSERRKKKPFLLEPTFEPSGWIWEVSEEQFQRLLSLRMFSSACAQSNRNRIFFFEYRAFNHHWLIML